MNTLRVVSIACLAVIASCGSSSTAPNYGGGGTPPPSCVPGSGTVCLVAGNQFSPTQITVAAGSSVTFNNVSGTTHNVTFTTAGAPANVPDFASGTQVVAFSTAGSYNYHCTIHGLSMSGVVVVQ
jgi:plastocyanin